jgi:hypothetical protein
MLLIGAALGVSALAAFVEDGPAPATAPTPPQQGAPWTPPDTRLPKFLVTATADLFAQGVPDPRGCEYREVTFSVPPAGMFATVEPADAGKAAPAAFVLPAPADGDGRRYAIDWDAQLRRVERVGPPVDLAADVAALVARVQNAREPTPVNAAETTVEGGSPPARARPRRFSAPWPESSDDEPARGVISPMRAVILLRLGRADLSERLFGLSTGWTPDRPSPDLTDYGVTYLSLAQRWTALGYNRGIQAHGAGDDATALGLFRRLATFRTKANARAEALGFQTPRNTGGFATSPPDPRRREFFPEMRQLDELLADQEQRAKEPPVPTPASGADPAARVAALIQNLNQIKEDQMSNPGWASPGSSPLVGQLIAMGDAAVEPLLEALVHDKRMTRSLAFGHGFGPVTVSDTTEAIMPALHGLMKTEVRDLPRLFPQDDESRRVVADAFRRHWKATRDVPPVELFYKLLADDAKPDGWLEGARGLTTPEPSDRLPNVWALPPTGPALGESIRQGREPSITQLLIQRTATLGRQEETQRDLTRAHQMAAMLAKWEPSAALPSLQSLSAIARRLYDSPSASGSGDRDAQAATFVRLLQSRLALGDRSSLDDYAAWIRTIKPAQLDRERAGAFELMWLEPEHPAIADAARAIFSDPKSPWPASLSGVIGPTTHGHGDALEQTPLLRLAPFRDAVFAGLANTTPAGECFRQPGAPHMLSYQVSGGGGSFGVVDGPGSEPLPEGKRQPVRACDWLAYRLSTLDGTPAFSLEWPEPRRDQAIAAIQAFLQAHGDRYEAASTVQKADPFEPLTRLAYPPLGRPATADDVRADRAIFSLAGEGDEVRTVPLPRIPMRAVWRTTPGAPILGIVAPEPGQGRDPSLDDAQVGRIWQAEEVRVGGTWRRFFGYVGPSEIGRVPAESVAFFDGDRFSGYPKTALGSRLTLDTGSSPFALWRGLSPTDPIEMVVTIWNRTGLDQDAPVEFVRHGKASGGLSLRCGVDLSLRYTPIPPTSFEAPATSPPPPAVDVPPSSGKNRFDDPSPATRHLGPGAGFEAFRLNLRDEFDLSRPGRYELTLLFDESLGLSPDGSSSLTFQINPDGAEP